MIDFPCGIVLFPLQSLFRTYAGGGAIWAWSEEFVISDCVFVRNIAVINQCNGTVVLNGGGSISIVLFVLGGDGRSHL